MDWKSFPSPFKLDDIAQAAITLSSLIASLIRSPVVLLTTDISVQGLQLALNIKQIACTS